jgi:hypothetical protein
MINLSHLLHCSLQLAGVVALLQQHVRLGQADLWSVEFDTTVWKGLYMI